MNGLGYRAVIPYDRPTVINTAKKRIYLYTMKGKILAICLAVGQPGILLLFGTGLFGLATFIRRK